MLCVLMMIIMMIEAQNCEAKSRLYEFCSAKTKQNKIFSNINGFLITPGELSLKGNVEITKY